METGITEVIGGPHDFLPPRSDRSDEFQKLCDCEVYSIQHYMIKFVSDMQQVCGFLRVLWFSPPIKLTTTI
jgi:hypothetical protein